MEGRVLEHENESARELNEKLYLNSRTADVHFGFGKGTKHPERVPAHKNILSVLSPVFDTMFYGSLPETGDIPIVDASAEVFKEFLQFFYMGTVRLTSKNIADVMNLCKKYEVDQGLKICEIILQNTLTNNDVCWGYAVASFLEQKDLMSFCEQKIKENPSEVIKSDSFLECDHKTMAKILELVSMKCCASEIVFGCMEWAKADCERNDREANSINLRNQLGKFFNQIPFHKLTIKQFTQHITTYKGFFSGDELENTIQQIVANETSVTKSASNKDSPTGIKEKGIVICDRKWYFRSKIHVSPHAMCVTRFSISFDNSFKRKKLLLTDFYIKLEQSNKGEKVLRYKIRRRNINSGVKTDLFDFQEFTSTRDDEIHIVLSEPVAIEDGGYYEIMTCNFSYSIAQFYIGAYKLKNGISIDFENNIYVNFRDVVSKLVFKEIS